MEERNLKLNVTKGGSGSSTFRVTVPAKWIRDMGLGEDERNLAVSYDEIKKEITVKKLEGGS